MRIENSLRLHYRMLDEDDRDFVFQLNKNPEVMRYINGGKPTSREEVVRDFMPRLNAYKDVDKGWGVWKVSVIATQESIGFIIVRPMNFFSDAPSFEDLEFGWRFLQPSWGKGYATEAALHIKKIFSKLPEYKYMSAIAEPENKASIRVMEKMGMQYIKSYTHCDTQLGEFDVVLYRLEL
ncbi:MAG: GNAT family N-acetyltransferase [Gammaproteobacteria bacterium]|nr:GNAT family N-acetyltransferase [Gammaproteobacteria bacterium]